MNPPESPLSGVEDTPLRYERGKIISLPNQPTPELQEMIAATAEAAVSDHFRDQCYIEFTAALLSANCGLGLSPKTTADRLIREVGIVTEKLVEFRRTTRVSRAAIHRETVAAADEFHETQ